MEWLPWGNLSLMRVLSNIVPSGACSRKLPAGLAKDCTLAEAERRGGRDLEHERDIVSQANDHAVADVIVPVRAILRFVQVGDTTEQGIIGDIQCIALDDQVEAFLVQVVAASGQDTMRIV